MKMCIIACGGHGISEPRTFGLYPIRSALADPRSIVFLPMYKNLSPAFASVFQHWLLSITDTRFNAVRSIAALIVVSDGDNSNGVDVYKTIGESSEICAQKM